MSQLQKFEQAIKEAKSVKELFTLPDVRDRFIKNYQSVTNRDDGENRLEQERFAYLQIIADKPDLQKVDNFFHVAALIYAGTTGLSFRDNKLYVRSNGKGGLKVDSSPAGKREMFHMMPTVKDVPEGVIVYMGDHFVHDKRNHCVKEHWSTDKTKELNNIDNIRATYQTITYKDGTAKDVVVYNDEIRKAMAKSPMQGDKSTWATWTAEMAKKTAMNRAFRLYHHYPDNVVLYGPSVEAEDISHEDVTIMPDAPVYSTDGEEVDTTTGEVINPLPDAKESSPKSFM
ncbi:MAG TPA: recombinase RecT [Cyclobacteriaceae bacterium]|jgi:recombinational DNA repair protein RecT|nr:recombinase RecT [Cyclobacteriaceae bacterium]